MNLLATRTGAGTERLGDRRFEPRDADAIATIDTSGGANAARPSSGNDAWAGADGSVLLRVTTAPSYDTLWIAAKASDRIFQDGFND